MRFKEVASDQATTWRSNGSQGGVSSSDGQIAWLIKNCIDSLLFGTFLITANSHPIDVNRLGDVPSSSYQSWTDQDVLGWHSLIFVVARLDQWLLWFGNQ